jgi:hypothetical protein
MQHYIIKFASDLRQVGGFLRVLQFSPTNKTDCHDITEISLKVALNTTTLTRWTAITICLGLYLIVSKMQIFD